MGKADKPNLLNKIKHLGDSYLAFSTEHRNSIRVYCSDCKKELRYPTQDEITEWIGKNK